MANILLFGTDADCLATDELILRERGHRVLAYAGCAPAIDEILAKTDLVICDVSTMNAERWQQLKSINSYRKANGDRLPIFCKSSVLHLPAIVLRIERLCTRYAYAK
jgi:DNA-binding NtrC family response regulator